MKSALVFYNDRETNVDPIRLAQLTDAGELGRLTSELGYAGTAAEITARLTMLLASSRHRVLVAEAGTLGLSGWVVIERRMALESGERAEISGLVVSDATRRTGVGRALVRAAEHWATRQGLTAVCVRSDVIRQASHPFYENLGYHRIKTQHVYNKTLQG